MAELKTELGEAEKTVELRGKNMEDLQKHILRDFKNHLPKNKKVAVRFVGASIFD